MAPIWQSGDWQPDDRVSLCDCDARAISDRGHLRCSVCQRWYGRPDERKARDRALAYLHNFANGDRARVCDKPVDVNGLPVQPCYDTYACLSWWDEFKAKHFPAWLLRLWPARHVEIPTERGHEGAVGTVEIDITSGYETRIPQPDAACAYLHLDCAFLCVHTWNLIPVEQAT